MRFLALLIAIIFIEISVFIQVGAKVGVVGTLLLLILSTFVGIQLLRAEGFMSLMSISREMEQGQVPTEKLLSTMMLAVVGVLFIIPGFFTSILGLIGLLPLVRRFFARQWLKRGVNYHQSTIIEAEFNRANESEYQGIIIEHDDNQKKS